MGKNFKWKVLVIVAIVAGSCWAVWPPQEKINLGLDLQGGMHIALQVQLDKIPEAARKDAVDRAIEIIRNRIDSLGVKEPQIQKQGIDKIIVQLPGVTDRERAIAILGKTAHMEFKLVAEPKPTQDFLDKIKADKELNELLDAASTVDDYKALSEKAQKLPGCENYEIAMLFEEQNPAASEQLVLEKKAVVSGDHLMNAGVSFNSGGMAEPIVTLSLDKIGGKAFSNVTQESSRKFTIDGIARRLAIVLDNKVYSAPQIKEHIPSGQAIIQGSFTYQDASDLALVLRAGALPAPVVVAEERTVGPTLGNDSIRQGIAAGLWGLILVLVIMLVYYMVCGMIANVALLLNMIILLGAMASCKATLTLPGIAGIILTIGMAVDANVLIYERIREELATGKMCRAAISSGYHRAFSAIFDSNLTTIISAALLFWFGTGPIKGFAITLTLGIAISMFTALFVTRVIFDYLTRDKKEISLKMLQAIKSNTKIDFVGKRYIAYTLSTIVIVASIVCFFMRGDKNYGIDFTGGTLQQIKFKAPIDTAKVRSALTAQGINDAQIQNFGERGANEIIIRTKAESIEKTTKAVDDLVGKEGYEVLRVERVGPSVGSDLRAKAIKSLALSLLAIIIYVGWRFKSFVYGFAAVIALFHDVIVTVGALALTGREFSLTIIAALLTIIGYSVNDTIVIFDRIREDEKIMKKTSFKDIINASVNQTLARTIMTSFTVFVVVICLFLFGGQVINDFAFAMLVGVITGVYSTVYVASPLVMSLIKKK